MIGSAQVQPTDQVDGADSGSEDITHSICDIGTKKIESWMITSCAEALRLLCATGKSGRFIQMTESSACRMVPLNASSTEESLKITSFSPNRQGLACFASQI
jgi:hypothetical protein